MDYSMTSTVFKNATLVDARYKERRPGFEVLVENNLIREVSQERVSHDAVTVMKRWRDL